VWRQRSPWQRQAALDLSRRNLAAGIKACRDHGCIDEQASPEDVRSVLLALWQADRTGHPQQTGLFLASGADECRRINQAVREHLRARRALGPEVQFQTRDGARSIATGARIVLAPEGPGTGSLGSVRTVTPESIEVQLDCGRVPSLDPRRCPATR
jgi:hypothetical protein